MGLLRDLGYSRVRDYTGGLREWLEAGLPVEQDPGAPPAVTLFEGRGARFQRRFAQALMRPMQSVLDLMESFSFGWLLTGWLAMVIFFGIFYFLLGANGPALLELNQPVQADRHGFLVSLYFSFVCATTVGFGDVVPLGLARGAALVEAVVALLVFGSVVSKLVSRRQEHLTEEIHRITSEDRLGRMQMNLHMVLSELRSVGEPGDEHQRRETMYRLEGITMVFTGELRAVHDLLFRPQNMPEAHVLESLLARVAHGLSELASNLERLKHDGECPGTLVANLKAATETAAEICGDCVPRSHAAGVKAWMDRVQEQGKRLSHACALKSQEAGGNGRR